MSKDFQYKYVGYVLLSLVLGVVGIGEHPDLVSAIESQFDVIANARDKLDAIDEFEKDE